MLKKLTVIVSCFLFVFFTCGVCNGYTSDPSEKPSGWVTAIDGGTGEVRWKYHASDPIVAGVTVTSGGLVFTGDLERPNNRLRIVDLDGGGDPQSWCATTSRARRDASRHR